MFAYAGDLPLISGLDDYAPSAITRVYASNGETLAEFATERRLVISYDEISPYLRNAIISAEDKDFNNHFGLSVSAMLIRLTQRHDSPRDCRGRQHADDAARARSVSRRGRLRTRDRRARNGRSRRFSSPFRSRSATRSGRSSRSTPTRRTSATARTASKPRRASISASARRTSRSKKPR